MRTILLCAIPLLGILSHATEIRVKSPAGVPQIHVNGQAVRSRWLFVHSPGAYRVAIGKEWMQCEEIFTAQLENCKPITLHFRFDHKPATIWLDDVSVTELESGAELFPEYGFSGGMGDFRAHWSYWPADRLGKDVELAIDDHAGFNGGGCLKLTFKDFKGSWHDFHIFTTNPRMEMVRGRKYRLKYKVKSDVDNHSVAMFYRPGNPFAAAGRFEAMNNPDRSVFHSQIKLAKDVGVDFITIPFPLVWNKTEERDSDYDVVESRMNEILVMNPNAKVIPRLWVGPPDWWLKENPTETMAWVKAKNEINGSISSRKWLEAACQKLERQIRYMEARWPDNMAGYHPINQHTGEWFYLRTWNDDYHGYSKCEQDAFKKWIANKYKTDQALQAAWRNPTITLATAECPPVDIRINAPVKGGLLSPETHMQLIDHNQFLQDEMANAVCRVAKSVRNATDGKKLSVFFYGYAHEFSLLNRMSASGHYAMGKILQSPDIDILCSPISYQDRQLGGSAPTMSSTESVAMHGKLWLCEDDTSTHLSTEAFPGHLQRAKNLWESQQMLLRNLGAQACRNQASWWMDLGGSGWFNDPELWTQMKLFQPVDDYRTANPTPFKPDVALVVDERTAMYGKDANWITRMLVSDGRAQCARSGAAFGQFLLEDVLSGKVESKVIVLANAFVLDDQQRDAIRALQEASRFIVWCYAPGLAYPDRAPEVKNVSQLTGFDLKELPEDIENKVSSTPLGISLGLPETWEGQERKGMLLGVANALDDEILARWSDGAAAVVCRSNSIFCAIPQLQPALIRLAAQKVGVKVWTKDECVLYHKDPYLVVVATKDGTFEIDAGDPVDIKDIVTGKTSVKTATWKSSLKQGETRILEIAR